jgi:hypothetical protein
MFRRRALALGCDVTRLSKILLTIECGGIERGYATLGVQFSQSQGVP